MYLAAQHLLLDTMTNDDMMCLKLLLSRVVNISNPTFKNLMAKYLEPDVLQSFEQALSIPFELDPTISDFIIQVEAKEDDVDAILELVCEQKLKYLQHKTSDMYASILSTNGLLGVTDTMYFDVVGTVAYLFLLRYLREHQLYLGSLVADVLHFPTNALFLGDLRSLITALFQFKQFVLGQEKMIRRTTNKQLARKRSATIVDTTNLPSSSAGDQHSYPPGYIFFSPKAALQKKARIDTDNDDTDKDNESREDWTLLPWATPAFCSILSTGLLPPLKFFTLPSLQSIQPE